jgi:hypothetical protein
MQTTSDNVTTVRYTLPKSVGEHGCRLYSEGRFTIPASLMGPQAVGVMTQLLWGRVQTGGLSSLPHLWLL